MTRTFLDRRGPIPFAHRGGGADQPENTMAAFAAVIALGYEYAETDVHTTADGVVLAFHDDVLDRVTDRRGRIDTLPIATVEGADAAYHFSRDGGRTHPLRGRDVRIPRLEHLLEQWPELHLNIDPKADSVVDPLVDLLGRMEALDRVCIGSFSDRRLARIRAATGDRVCTSMGPRAVTLMRLAAWSGRVRRSGADCIQIPLHQFGVPLVTQRTIRAAHRSGLVVHVWTIDDAPTMRRLLDLGVDGLMSDRPTVLREVMRERGLWRPLPTQ